MEGGRSLAPLLAICLCLAASGCQPASKPAAPRIAPPPSAPAPTTTVGQSPGGAQAGSGAQPAGADLFPHAPGATWKLRMATQADTGAGVRDVSYDITQTVLPADPTDTPGSYRVETKRGDSVTARDDYLIDDEGVFYVGTELPATSQIDPPMPILKLPMPAAGMPNTWSWKGAFKSSASDTPAEAQFKLTGPEQVQTSAGTYAAYKIDEQLTVKSVAAGVPTSITLWVAPNVGLVKQAVYSPDRSGVAVLVSHSSPGR